MTLRLTRQQLYDLVWANPITHVAAQPGISDVMLARICAQKDVPRPHDTGMVTMATSGPE